MKKITGIIGVVMIAMTMFFNVSLTSSESVNDNLVTLTSIASANADGGERYALGVCIYENGAIIANCSNPSPSGPCDRKEECTN